MAIKVVGKCEKIVKKITCQECGSILEYLPIDVEKRSICSYPGELETYRFIKCPECKHDVSVN